MREQQDNEFVLPEERCWGFDSVADWIYNGSMIRDITLEETQDFHAVIIAHMLADKYCMPKLQKQKD